MPHPTRILGLAVSFVCALTLIAGCAARLETQPDPLAEYRAANLRPAESRAELMALVTSSRTLRNPNSVSVNGVKLQDKPITIDEEETQDPSLTIDDEEAADIDRVQVTGSKISAADIITNVQTPGIDEGGIVKRVGDVLIVLRGSVIHTVLMREQDKDVLRIVQSLDLKGGDNEDDTYYDEVIAFDGVYCCSPTIMKKT